MNIQAFWDAVLRQDADAIREYFHPDAWVDWHNTNELFTVEEFIRANCSGMERWSRSLPPIPISLLPLMCTTRMEVCPAMPHPFSG